ncbi:Ldh family oxidoreductase [Algihabitans albus]|uniref:Ldh family oxidoreductase n=1 Tax=Algihabitans albus TaxID=2164067 RepID=UPI000E5CFF02|nr:Ldh family oxidoreductase [Algihabitans albus]
MTDDVLTDPDQLTSLIGDVLLADGCSSDEATCVAAHLVDASLCGHDSHGVIRLPRYHSWLGTGRIRARQSLSTIATFGAARQFDGGSGMGQWLAREATAEGIALASEQGIGVIVLRRAGHVGRVGAYAEQAAEAGYISLFFVNVGGSRLVAPFGTAQRAGSTAPVTIGIPNREGDDFILDFATSKVAEGKALVAARGGTRLPHDALMAADGLPTDDPEALYGESLRERTPNPQAGPGALRAFGDHKGSGLMLACELLGGALTGNGTNGRSDCEFGNGMLAVFLDPARFDDLGMFGGEVAHYIDFVRGRAPAQGIESVLIPGDKERRTRAERLKQGLPVPRPVLTAILKVAAELDLEWREDRVTKSSRPQARSV